MTEPKAAARGFMFVGVLFLIVTFIQVARGKDLNAVFLAVALVFFILAAAIANKKPGAGDASPPPPPPINRPD